MVSAYSEIFAVWGEVRLGRRSVGANTYTPVVAGNCKVRFVREAGRREVAVWARRGRATRRREGGKADERILLVPVAVTGVGGGEVDGFLRGAEGECGCGCAGVRVCGRVGRGQREGLAVIWGRS